MPIKNLLDTAKSLDTGAKSAVDAFKEQVLSESEKTLAAIDALKDEIEELEK
jgi:hypothetical protein